MRIMAGPGTTLPERRRRGPAACTLALIALLACSADASAQLVLHQSGIKAGLTFATLTTDDADGTDPDEAATSQRPGFTGGLFGARHITPALLGQVEALISVKGAVRPAERLRVTYLEVPVLAKLTFHPSPTRRETFYVVGGPAIGLRLSATVNRDDGRSEDAGADFRALDLGVHLGGGIERDGLLFEIRYARSLLDVRGQRETGDAVHHRTLTFMAGLRIPR